MSKTQKTKTKKKASPKRGPDFLSGLRPGDTIEIIAPASQTPPGHLEKGCAILKSWGYNVIFDENILDPRYFLANSDEYRFESFKNAMNNPQSKVVWCLRGGYGSIRLLPFIQKMSKPKHAKLLIGLSDITSLQTIITKKWNFPSLHASLVDRLAMERLTEENIIELQKVLTDPDHVMEFDNLQPLNSAARKTKKIKSSVIGGNLMVAASSLGTPSQIDTKGRIVFLEELGERAYRVDRCLQQLKQSGCFDKASAVVFGDFTHCDEPNKDNFIADILELFCRDLKIPAFKGLENGHGDLQRPLFFNTEAHLTCANEGRMLVYSPFKRAK